MAMSVPVPFKIPESVLVVIHTVALEVLILQRADHASFWQSVTGSLDDVSEPAARAAQREVAEETGIDAHRFVLTDWHHAIRYSIYPQWRHRYAPGVTENTEHWFGLTLPARHCVRLSPREHIAFEWLDYRSAARRCFSPSNQEAILRLPEEIARGAT